MKYEMIFGDPQLFNHAPEDAVLVSVQLGDFRYFAEENLQACKKFNIYKFQTCDTQLAMRRIIQEPKRWTVEDQKAGRLPEVGANVEFVFNNEFNYYEPIEEFASGDILDVLAHVYGGNGGMCVAVYNRRTRYTTQLVIESIRPLETPEEKAERLRNEWVDSAYGNTCIFGGTSEGEKQRLKSHLRSVYDSILSGELSVPTKGGE